MNFSMDFSVFREKDRLQLEIIANILEFEILKLVQKLTISMLSKELVILMRFVP